MDKTFFENNENFCREVFDLKVGNHIYFPRAFSISRTPEGKGPPWVIYHLREGIPDSSTLTSICVTYRRKKRKVRNICECLKCIVRNTKTRKVLPFFILTE